MKLRILQLMAALILASMGGEVRGNVYRAVGNGNTITPMRSTEIAMDAETVAIRPDKDHEEFFASAVYTMRNTSNERITHQVAFPFESRGLASIAKESFRVRVGENDSAPLVSPIELKVRDDSSKAPRTPHDFAAALVWTITWEPGETKLIRLSYTMGEPDPYLGLVHGWRLRYVVKTGALWKGPIGRADFTMSLEGHQLYSLDFASAAGAKDRAGRGPLFSYPANARQTSPHEVTWHFENWTPDEDVWLGVLVWSGFENPRHAVVRMPVPYAGATEQYTDALVERLVDRELAPWREMFPQETKQFRGTLKKLAAEWLYREMFARHGDPFYLGKYQEGVPVPVDPNGYGPDQDGNYRSLWDRRFPPAWRGGWYEPKPGRGPNGSVPLEDLTPQEQKNAAFLRPYFSP